ncbi:tetratricopeptide repeat protein [Anaerosacchariphilus polymeriproducens]|uniref:Tetratricopeptide repeat protein n=1 Tax=Anaerosacchariphilus polymeriproducens TaxID=1812858 RepID=A0A371AS08_9FIRM|nr:tetratricopeptide repeat protein [Anaerosacchariphilus polymeriproducens]RDU22260.1 tetratricopeptide repeat protein [Anaerosacchariphilus polymeriproducens]
MNCFNCKATLTDSDFCTECGVDVAVYKKILRLSNHYYNVGLEKATVRDLSGAVTSLKKSLKYNKENIQARNLLGLVYNEMGETVKALGEWVISKSMQSQHNLADDYLKAVQSNQGRLDAVNQTIKKYNQALLYCQQESEDLAIIQLKKVLSLNPKLIQGHQLIALLYMKQGEWEKARKALNTAIKIDTNNTTTLRYLREVKEQMHKGASVVKKKSDKVSYVNGNEVIIQPTGLKDFSGISIVVNIGIGILIGLCVAWFLIVPSIKQSSNSDATKALVKANEQIASKNANISSLKAKVEEAKQEAEASLKKAQDSEAVVTSYEQFVTALNAYMGKDDNAAYQALTAVNPDQLSEACKGIYETFKSELNEKLVGSLYTEGKSAYYRRDYSLAAAKLEQVIAIDEKYSSGDAIFHLAEAYRKLEDKEKAIATYQKVIELMPGTAEASTAQDYISQLQVNENQQTDGAQNGSPDNGMNQPTTE